MPPVEEHIIITLAIIIAAFTVMTLYVLFFNMKDVCFSKYTTAVLKKELSKQCLLKKVNRYSSGESPQKGGSPIL
jgi:hypothetical protein